MLKVHTQVATCMRTAQRGTAGSRRPDLARGTTSTALRLRGDQLDRHFTYVRTLGGHHGIAEQDPDWLRGMCEIHYLKCTSCGRRWEAHKKLASCEEPDEDVRCPDHLVMYVGIPRRPEKGECEDCRRLREVMETLEDGDE